MVLCAAVCMLASERLKAGEILALPVVRPVTGCGAMVQADLSPAVGAPTRIISTVETETPTGRYCVVTGKTGKATIFEVHLPEEHWTQRFLEEPVNAVSPAYASGCAPADHGEMAVAFDNQGHSDEGSGEDWITDPELRIDFAYRANHRTALAARALIRLYYGQPQRFSYFVGCSEGGREALVEAQRFPEDFDGIVAGSPITIDSVHNAFFHPWESHANRGADGLPVLRRERMAILHEAVLRHCAASAGLLDGVLALPAACHFDPVWVECRSGSADTSACLTRDEVKVVRQLYRGPNDGVHDFEFAGFPGGTEMQWGLSTPDHVADREYKNGFQLRRLILGNESRKTAEELEQAFNFDLAWFNKTLPASYLYNAGNTDLRSFAAHGGKLLLWNGAEDTTIQQETTLAYYEGVQRLIGSSATDRFLRLFIVPGMGHCLGGDLPFQLDLLTPIMVWTERHQAPEKLIAGKTQTDPYLPRSNGKRVLAMPGGAWKPHDPLPVEPLPTLFTRPVYPYPYVARYGGRGDTNSAASYRRVRSGAVTPHGFQTEARRLIGPHTQKFYESVDGRLVESHP